MSNEIFGICDVFLLTFGLLLLRQGLLLISDHKQKLPGVCVVRHNRDDCEPGPDSEPGGEDAFIRRLAASSAALAVPGAHRRSIATAAFGRAAEGEGIQRPRRDLEAE